MISAPAAAKINSNFLQRSLKSLKTKFFPDKINTPPAESHQLISPAVDGLFINTPFVSVWFRDDCAVTEDQHFSIYVMSMQNKNRWIQSSWGPSLKLNLAKFAKGQYTCLPSVALQLFESLCTLSLRFLLLQSHWYSATQRTCSVCTCLKMETSASQTGGPNKVTRDRLEEVFTVL